MDRDTIESTIREYFRNKPDIRVVILFGSAVRGKLMARSDIDIAVASGSPLSAEKLAEIQLDLSSALRRNVDIVDLHHAQGLILREILSKGVKLLNQNPVLLASFIRKMWYYEADMMPNIRLILKKRARRFADGV